MLHRHNCGQTGERDWLLPQVRPGGLSLLPVLTRPSCHLERSGSAEAAVLVGCADVRWSLTQRCFAAVGTEEIGYSAVGTEEHTQPWVLKRVLRRGSVLTRVLGCEAPAYGEYPSNMFSPSSTFFAACECT